MIYTSYYNKRNKGKGKMIAISRTIPKWLNKEDYVHLPCVSPSHNLREKYKNNEISFNQFIEEFRSELTKDDLKQLISEIPESGDCYLLCHEKDINTCHRWFLSYCLNRLGLKCEEYE